MDEEMKQAMKDLGYVGAPRGEEKGWRHPQTRRAIMRPDARLSRWYVYEWVNGTLRKSIAFTSPVAAAVWLNVETTQ